MFRLATRSALGALRTSSKVSVTKQSLVPVFTRFYSANALTSEEITRRIAEANNHLIKSDVEIKPETTLTQDLGLDSLDATEFLVNVENEFDLQLSDEDSEKVKTIGEIVELISNNPQAS